MGERSEATLRLDGGRLQRGGDHLPEVFCTLLSNSFTTGRSPDRLGIHT
eukprot:COSAG02_NODE_7676_length_2898_cov_31.313683_3_plen_49_part_00